MRAYSLILLPVVAVLLAACAAHTAETFYRQGRQCRENGMPVEAVEAFMAATRVNSREYAFKARSFSNMATMCRIGERHDLAFALYERSLHQFALAKDTLAQAYALNNMAWEQAVLGNKPGSLQLAGSALSLCSDTAVQHKVLESRAAACLYAAEYDSVLWYARRAPARTLYLDMLCAQAYTFLGNKDSALLYAKQVVTHTDNPRYLDDVYYILAQCDASAQAEEVRVLAAARTDIQRGLERNNTQWIEAMLLAEKALETPSVPIARRTLILLAAVALALALTGTTLCLWRRRQSHDTLEEQCRILRQSPDLRGELQWNDYQQFAAVCNARLSGIVAKLEQRGLSEREIRICVLVLIGLSYAQMAEVLFRAESGIGKDKYMVAKRLGVSVRDLQMALTRIADGSFHA